MCVCVCVTKRELLKQVCDESNCEAPAAYRISFYVLNATGINPPPPSLYLCRPLSSSLSIHPQSQTITLNAHNTSLSTLNNPFMS